MKRNRIAFLMYLRLAHFQRNFQSLQKKLRNCPSEYQGKEIGKSIVERLLQHVYSCTPNGTFTTVGLMAAQGKEGFYEKLGFQAMPNAGSGAGMTRYIEKNWRNSSSDL